MKRRRHTAEQIIRKLREADRLLAEGQKSEVAEQLEVSEATYHHWRAQYGGLKADDVSGQGTGDANGASFCAHRHLGRPQHAVPSANPYARSKRPSPTLTRLIVTDLVTPHAPKAASIHLRLLDNSDEGD
jgi:hypothetical protein